MAFIGVLAFNGVLDDEGVEPSWLVFTLYLSLFLRKAFIMTVRSALGVVIGFIDDGIENDRDLTPDLFGVFVAS